MSRCQHYDICGLDADVDPAAGLCILHSMEESKDQTAFDSALVEHRKKNGDNFNFVVFPSPVSFENVVFENDVKFLGARFFQDADFENAEFRKDTSFRGAIFRGLTNFRFAKFKNAAFFNAAFWTNANFDEATFEGDATFYFNSSPELAAEKLPREAVDVPEKLPAVDEGFRNFSFMFVSVGGKADFSGRVFGRAQFSHSTFVKRADFDRASFEQADFVHTTFEGGANFIGAEFGVGLRSEHRVAANFQRASFFGPTIFSPKRGNDASQIFRDVKVDFRAMMIQPLDALVIRDADLRKCQFYDTDLREAELSAITWPTKRRRLVVYDEILDDIESPKRRQREEYRRKLNSIGIGRNDSGTEGSGADIEAASLFGIERLYRQLKQNCERRGDYERAGDFHFGEKEMRRRNPKTSSMLRFFLTAYWLLSGYGERYLRPLIWAAGILVASACFYLLLGIKAGTLVLTNPVDWLRVLHYSFRVMALLKPNELIRSESALLIVTVQSIAGPILFGLFALALRQRLKR